MAQEHNEQNICIIAKWERDFKIVSDKSKADDYNYLVSPVFRLLRSLKKTFDVCGRAEFPLRENFPMTDSRDITLYLYESEYKSEEDNERTKQCINFLEGVLQYKPQKEYTHSLLVFERNLVITKFTLNLASIKDIEIGLRDLLEEKEAPSTMAGAGCS